MHLVRLVAEVHFRLLSPFVPSSLCRSGVDVHCKCWYWYSFLISIELRIARYVWTVKNTKKCVGKHNAMLTVV